MKNTSGFLVLFITVGIAQLLGAIFDLPLIQDVSKPFIIISLIGYYWMKAEDRSLLFTCALLFCLAGDVLLIFQLRSELFFIFGLVSFLIGHLLYMISYNQLRSSEVAHELLWTQKVRFSLPIILAETGLITVLFSKLGPLKTPVLVYSIVLIGMVMTALFRYGRTTSKSFWQIFSGALLFMTSDSLLAINKFYTPLPLAGLLIMTTYICAQFLIVEGAIEHKH